MSEAIIIALVSAISGTVGAGIHAGFEHHHNAAMEETDSADLLLKAQSQLTATMEDMTLLWQWNRALVDHIYKGSPPPPPLPPDGLFNH
ncbi:MAG: hypothetical protein LKJ44_08090 [Bifidobacteriaceae bacterium]|jgi:hypothetical protein|nr:hypothetical protein [Bifidobacteriaceae bacterium]MCI1979644.1 hypothetical protein [Bifidobacteriaceae bacterium]